MKTKADLRKLGSSKHRRSKKLNDLINSTIANIDTYARNGEKSHLALIFKFNNSKKDFLKSYLNAVLKEYPDIDIDTDLYSITSTLYITFSWK